MKNLPIMRTLTYVVLGGMALLLLLNISRIFSPKNERYLSYNGVKGMAVDHQRQLWTLSFEQQNSTIDFINRSLPIGRNVSIEKKDLPFERLIIYRFKGPDLTVTLVGYNGYNLVLECKEWNPDGYLLDVSNGRFDTLLKGTYDP